MRVGGYMIEGKLTIPEAIELARKKSEVSNTIKQRESRDRIRIETYIGKSLKDLTIGDEISLDNREIVEITGITLEEILIEKYDDGDCHGINIIDLHFCRYSGRHNKIAGKWYNDTYSQIYVLNQETINTIYLGFLGQCAYSILQTGVNMPRRNKEDIIEYIYWLLPFSEESKDEKSLWYIGE